MEFGALISAQNFYKIGPESLKQSVPVERRRYDCLRVLLAHLRGKLLVPINLIVVVKYDNVTLPVTTGCTNHLKEKKNNFN